MVPLFESQSEPPHQSAVERVATTAIASIFCPPPDVPSCASLSHNHSLGIAPTSQVTTLPEKPYLTSILWLDPYWRDQSPSCGNGNGGGNG